MWQVEKELVCVGLAPEICRDRRQTPLVRFPLPSLVIASVLAASALSWIRPALAGLSVPGETSEISTGIALLSLGAVGQSGQETAFTSNTLIDANNITYDGQDIVVSGCILTVSGAHSFNRLRVTSGGTITHSAATTGQASYRISLTVAHDMMVDAGCRISADGNGYGSASGPGAGGSGSDYGGGAGYGGSGGRGRNGTGGTTYGSIMEPSDLGSGGGKGGSYYDGGSGGGMIRLTVGGTLTIEGSVTANGSDVHYGGGGSGGSIYVAAGMLAGKGTISANGGSDTYSYPYGGGGGGGRIAIYCSTNTFTGTESACGGAGFENGAAGTIFTKSPSQALGDLLINNGGRDATKSALTVLPSGATFNEVTVANQGKLDLSVADILMASRLVIADKGFVYLQTRMTTISSLHILSGGTLSHTAGQTGFDLRVPGDVTIDNGGSISADSKGYGSASGPGAGGRGEYGGGGGYGGLGGKARSEGTGGLTYGSITEPSDLGSGGGTADDSYYDGGAGGGAIHLTVKGTLTIEGSLTANGSDVRYGGGGSGGSIYVDAGMLAGKGLISANGGKDTYSYGYGGGGGGGRIAIYYREPSSFDPNRITVKGGTGYQSGQPGTVFLPNGPLVILFVTPLSSAPGLVDPVMGEVASLEYAVNKDCVVEARISGPASSDAVVITLTQSVTAGTVQSMPWDGLNATGTICKDGFYDVTITARSGTETVVWTSKGMAKTSPSVSNVAATAETRDPFRNVPLQIDFDISTWGTLLLRILRHSSQNVVSTIMNNDQILSPGHHTFYWDGRDSTGKIYNRSDDKGDVDVDFRVPEGVHVGPILVQSTKLEIRNLTCNAYRIIPSFSEVSSISYDLTRDARIEVQIIDPDGSHFRTLVDQSPEARGTKLLIWDGRDDKGRIISVEGVYEVVITAQDIDHPEVKCIARGVISAFK